MKWITEGFDGFRRGSFGNGGQNLYVSKSGVLQRIFNYDVNGDGYPDLPFANSHSMGERPPIYVYSDLPECPEKYTLPSNGTYDGLFTDLTGDGYDDLILACQNNGTLNDVPAVIYFGSELGLSEKYRMELPVPNASGVACGDFRGRGVNDLAFASGNVLRVFYQTEYGIEATKFTDYPFNAQSLAAADLDGDGYSDLYVLLKNGCTMTLWGGPDGFCEKSKVIVSETLTEEQEQTVTTAGRMPMHWTWRACIPVIQGKPHVFIQKQESASILYFDQERVMHEFLSIAVPGITAVTAGDLTGDGTDDLIVLINKIMNENADVLEEDSFVLLGNSDFKKSIPFKTVASRFASVSPLDSSNKNYLLLAQGGTGPYHTSESQILAFDTEGNIIYKNTIVTENTARLIAGRMGKGRYQLVSVNHESGGRLGDEDVYIYLGGSDGYKANRKMCFRGRSAVECLTLDIDDDGLTDVVVVNCAENAPELDPGILIYHNSKEGFQKDKIEALPTYLSHGAALGDFRHCGYIDLITGGIKNRELLIFRGGPNGYDTEHPESLIIGPKEEYQKAKVQSNLADMQTTEKENALIKEYGQVRWMFAADFNEDGWLDVFVSEITGPRCFILWGGPDGFSMDRIQWLACDGASSCNAADLNGNGYLDLIVAGHMSTQKDFKMESYLTIYWGGPDGFKENRKSQLSITCANSTAVGDFNHDGILDIFASSYNDGRKRDLDSYLYFGSKEGVFHQLDRQLLWSHSASGCMSGDFNGDGYTDLAVAFHKTYGNHIGKSCIYWGGPDGLREDRVTELPTVGPHGMCTIDIGNIMDRSDNEYWYSEVVQTVLVRCIYWEAENNINTDVFAQFRYADSEDDLKSVKWSHLLKNGEDLTELQIHGFVQYRLVLSAKSGCGSPRITKVEVEMST